MKVMTKYSPAPGLGKSAPVPEAKVQVVATLLIEPARVEVALLAKRIVSTMLFLDYPWSMSMLVVVV